MTHFLKFFLNKGRILALWVMYGLSGKLGDGHGQKKTLFNFFFLEIQMVKMCQKFGQGSPPPLLQRQIDLKYSL